MMDMKNNDAEINAIIANDSCNVVMKGTPDDLFNCICSIICALSRQIMNDDEMKTLQSEMELSDEMLEAYLTTLVISEIIESVDNVQHTFSKFNYLTDNEIGDSIEVLKEKFTNKEESSQNIAIDLDFDTLTNRNSEENNG